MADCGLAVGEGLASAAWYFHPDYRDDLSQTRTVGPDHFRSVGTELPNLKGIPVWVVALDGLSADTALQSNRSIHHELPPCAALFVTDEITAGRGLPFVP